MDARAGADTSSTYVRFPPRWENVLVPSQPASATALGMTLYTASRPLPVLAQRALWCLALASRGRVLPGSREQWSPPMPDDTYLDLWDAWAALIGRVPDAIAVYHRPQAERTGLTLLLCAGRSSALVRVRQDPGSLTLEREISTAAEAARPAAFRVPRLLGAGEVDGWSWVGYELIARRPHRPVRRTVPGLTDQISALVESVVPRPAGVPPHWRGSHGDLTPWNLRRSHTGTWLIDWEDACWAPPGADEVYFRATAAALGRRTVSAMAVPDEHVEALEYWAEDVRRRPRDDDLKRRLLTQLSPRDVRPGSRRTT
jgi:hypothetical protein